MSAQIFVGARLVAARGHTRDDEVALDKGSQVEVGRQVRALVLGPDGAWRGSRHGIHESLAVSEDPFELNAGEELAIELGRRLKRRVRGPLLGSAGRKVMRRQETESDDSRE